MSTIVRTSETTRGTMIEPPGSELEIDAVPDMLDALAGRDFGPRLPVLEVESSSAGASLRILLPRAAHPEGAPR